MPRVWALVLSAYLLGWIPIGFAAELFAAFPSIGRRGTIAAVELIVHGASAIMSATAGWMLLARAPVAGAASAAAVVLGSVVTIQSLFWTVLPRNVAPGDRLPLAILAVGNGVFWLMVIHRVRESETPDGCGTAGSRRQHDLPDHPA
jgi:hypothetical protein